MAQTRVFSLLGDSNIRQYVTKTSCRANPLMKSSQIISCGGLSIFDASLSTVRKESTVVIVSCLSNFLVAAKGSEIISQRISPILQDIKDILVAQCQARPGVAYLVSPPMYRVAPLWYREALPEIMTLFSQSMSAERPQNLHILPSFPIPDFQADGVHLTAYSGLEFIMHLFDAASELLDNASLPPTEQAAQFSEATRVLEDRMMAIEQDHRRLNKVVESKTAVDAELADFRENERMEDCFIIAGLERIDPEIVGKQWQEKAVKDVQTALVALMGKEYSIIVVHNCTRRVPDAEVTYIVRLASVQDCKAIRLKFGSFFLGGAGNDRRPEGLKGISIKNRVTPNTQTRISIMKLLAARYRDSNPGSKVKMIGYEPRPTLKITPAASASDRRIQVQASFSLTANFLILNPNS